MILATAGHVDHGKTTLIRALTGVETDRLAEEKRRGLTIELGYAYLPLPDGRVAGFVDVPGHERFVGTMVGGVCGIDAGLLVIAADDGPMPQTDEHLAILDLLDVPEVIIAITKVDRVAEDRVSVVADAVMERLARLGRRARASVSVSSVSGQGIEALKDVIHGVPRRPRGGGQGFRLAVDRSFLLDGAGLVVTGTAHAGRVSVGDEVMISPAALPVRVRALHVQGRESDSADAGARVALGLAGRNARREAVGRGDWIVSAAGSAGGSDGRFGGTHRLDLRIRAAADPGKAAGKPFPREVSVHCHHGAADVPGRCVLLDQRQLAPGEAAWAQIVLDRPIHARFGDRLVLRDQSARRTLAGGTVIAPFGAHRGRARPERLAELGALARTDPAEALTHLLEIAQAPVDIDAFRHARNLDGDASAALRKRVPVKEIAPSLVVTSARWAEWRDGAVSVLAETHRVSPELPGLDVGSLRRALPKPPTGRMAEQVLRALVAAGDLQFAPGGYCLPGHVARLSDVDTALWATVEPLFAAAAPSAPVVHEIAKVLGRPAREVVGFLGRVVRIGRLVQIARNRFLQPELLKRLAATAGTLDTGDGFDVAAFRDAAGIGRNLAIPVLEHFDRNGVTRRVGDRRHILRET